MTQLKILVPFTATCRKVLSVRSRTLAELSDPNYVEPRCSETFTDPKAYAAHVESAHGRKPYVMRGKYNGMASTPRPTGKIRQRDFAPKPGDPGSVLTWTQDGVERSGQVQFNGKPAKTVWVVPFERGEGEHAVLLNRYGHVLDTWGREFSATPEPLAPGEVSMIVTRIPVGATFNGGEVIDTWRTSKSLDANCAVQVKYPDGYLKTYHHEPYATLTVKLTTPEPETEPEQAEPRETFELEYRLGAGSLPACVIVYTEDGTIEFQREASSWRRALELALNAGYVNAESGRTHRSASGAQALWVTRETAPEPASPWSDRGRYEPDENGRAICRDCEAPSIVNSAPCDNPVCFPGLREYRAALNSWERGREATITREHGLARGQVNTYALREIYERQCPAPIPDDYRRPMEPAAASVEPASVTPEPWGKPYGTDAAYITPDGPVWLRRKGQRARFYDAAGAQVGPEQRNVGPAVAYAFAQGWRVPEPTAQAWQRTPRAPRGDRYEPQAGGAWDTEPPRDMTGLVHAMGELND